MNNTAETLPQAPDYTGELVELDRVNQALAALKAKHANVPDFSSKAGYDAGKKGIRELTSYRTATDKARLSITKPHREFIDRVNSYGKEIIGELEAIELPLKEAKKQEDERAEREKEARINMLRERLNKEVASFFDTAQGLDSTGLADLYDAAQDIDTSGYYDITQEAEDAKANVIQRLGGMHLDALKHERLAAEQAEIDAERRRLREEAERQAAERAELEELRREKAEREAAKAQAEEAAKRKPEPEPEPEPLPAAAEHKPLDASRISAAADKFQRGSQVSAPEQVTITRKEYDQLLADQAKLYALEAAGVDNWTGYGDAMAELEAA